MTPRIASPRVDPSAIAPSIRSRGVRENSSRQIAEVIGMIMIVSTSAAGSIPACDGSPEKSGHQPRKLCSHGSSVSRTQGPKTRMPQSPRTTLGTAASSSTSVAIGAAARRDLREEERDRDRERRREEQRDDRRDDRPVDERQGAV